MLRPSALIFLVAAAAAAQTPRPQPAPRAPTFRVGIEVVHLTVSVTDNLDRYVTQLGAEQFAVFEDGVRQDLTLFTHQDLPISLVLLVDTSASMEKKLAAAQAAAVRFVRTLKPEDRAQVVQFNDRLKVLQDFTSDQPKLEAAVAQLRAVGPTSLHNALYVSLKELDRQKQEAELRRRAVVLLSDGEDTSSLVSDEQVIGLAREAEIGVYAVRLRRKRVPDRDRMSFSKATYLLETLARDTGGRVYFPDALSELEAVYDRIAEELRTQYNLGYVSSNDRRDGKWRRIVVRVPSREDLQIRHRLGYHAVKPS